MTTTVLLLLLLLLLMMMMMMMEVSLELLTMLIYWLECYSINNKKL